jgi:hypothetical protein
MACPLVEVPSANDTATLEAVAAVHRACLEAGADH